MHLYSTAPRSLIELEIEIRAGAANSAAAVAIELASSTMATEKGAYFEISTVTLPPTTGPCSTGWAAVPTSSGMRAACMCAVP